MIKNKLKYIFLGTLSFFSYSFAESTFSVIPTQIVFEKAGKIKTVTVINQGDSLLNTQSSFKTYNQVQKGLSYNEVNHDLMGSPNIIATPIVLQNIPPSGKQDIRLLAVKQDPESELIYRFYVKNLTTQTLDQNGTQLSVAYGIPVYVLPLNIKESYNFSIIKNGNKNLISISNIGNVHLLFKELFIVNDNKKIAIGTVGRLLPNIKQEFIIPQEYNKLILQNHGLNISIAKSDLINFDQESKINLFVNAK